jgi:hypothetical protein
LRKAPESWWRWRELIKVLTGMVRALPAGRGSQSPRPCSGLSDHGPEPMVPRGGSSLLDVHGDSPVAGGEDPALDVADVHDGRSFKRPVPSLVPRPSGLRYWLLYDVRCQIGASMF